MPFSSLSHICFFSQSAFHDSQQGGLRRRDYVYLACVQRGGAARPSRRQQCSQLASLIAAGVRECVTACNCVPLVGERERTTAAAKWWFPCARASFLITVPPVDQALRQWFHSTTGRGKRRPGSVVLNGCSLVGLCVAAAAVCSRLSGECIHVLHWPVFVWQRKQRPAGVQRTQRPVLLHQRKCLDEHRRLEQRCIGHPD